MSTNIDRSFLSRICDPARPAIAAPFGVDNWDVATNGRCLLALSGRTLPVTTDQSLIAGTRRFVKLPRAVTVGVKLHRLQRWAGRADVARAVLSCDRAHGDFVSLLGGAAINRLFLALLLDGLPGDVVRVHVPKCAIDIVSRSPTGTEYNDALIHFIGHEWVAVLMPMCEVANKVVDHFEFTA